MIFAPLFLLAAAVALLLFVVAPLWLLASGFVRLANHNGGAFRAGVGGVWTLAVVAAALFVADGLGPRHERILDRGFTPDGREYCLLRVRDDGSRLADVRLYVRNEGGVWMWHDVEHDAWPWRSGGRLDFSDGTARVFRGDRFFRTVELLPPGHGPDVTPHMRSLIAGCLQGEVRLEHAYPPSATPEAILAGRDAGGLFAVTNGVIVDLPAPSPVGKEPHAGSEEGAK